MNAKDLVNEIIECELIMFLSVPAEGNPACRESPDNFRIHRSAQFSAWSEETLLSYLADLKAAETRGRNLMTYKYARMEEMIASENNSPYINNIVSAQTNWQNQVIEEYPKLMKNGRGLRDDDASVLDVSFERYLRAELESYSEKTLELLSADIDAYLDDGVNMSEQIYLNLLSNYGISSLESFKNN